MTVAAAAAPAVLPRLTSIVALILWVCFPEEVVGVAFDWGGPRCHPHSVLGACNASVQYGLELGPREALRLDYTIQNTFRAWSKDLPDLLLDTECAADILAQVRILHRQAHARVSGPALTAELRNMPCNSCCCTLPLVMSNRLHYVRAHRRI